MWHAQRLLGRGTRLRCRLLLSFPSFSTLSPEKLKALHKLLGNRHAKARPAPSPAQTSLPPPPPASLNTRRSDAARSAAHRPTQLPRSAGQRPANASAGPRLQQQQQQQQRRHQPAQQQHQQRRHNPAQQHLQQQQQQRRHQPAQQQHQQRRHQPAQQPQQQHRRRPPQQSSRGRPTPGSRASAATPHNVESVAAARRLAEMLLNPATAPSLSSSPSCSSSSSPPPPPPLKHSSLDNLEHFYGAKSRATPASSPPSSRWTRVAPPKHKANTSKRRAVRRKKVVLVDGEALTLRDVSERLSAPMSRVRRTLEALGERVARSGDAAVAVDAVPLIAADLGASFDVEVLPRAADDDADADAAVDADADDEVWPLRPVVVSVVGHVDHGKTTLMDALRHSHVANTEFGGITQRVGAFSVSLGDDASTATLLDTPGHAAFTAMRRSACDVTDVALLVVAADAGVQEQTIESIAAVRRAEVPLVVALTKTDVNGADTTATRAALLQHGVVDEALGGDVQVVEVSATTGDGLQRLRDALALAAEMVEARAPLTGVAAAGVVLQATMQRGRGVVVGVLGRRGTLRVGDAFVVGEHAGKVKAMYDERGAALKAATPSMPVHLLGVDGVPQAGDALVVLPSEKRAKEVAAARLRARLDAAAADDDDDDEQQQRVDAQQQGVNTLRLIVRADEGGALSALLDFVHKIPQQHVLLQVMDSKVGGIGDADIQLAKQADAVIVAFNVAVGGRLAKLANASGVRVHSHRLIYRAMDDIIDAVNQLMPFEETVEERSRAQVAAVFDLHGDRSKVVAKAAGCKVLSGTLERSSTMRVLRGADKRVVFEGAAESLRHLKADVPRIDKGHECGLVLHGFDDFRAGDLVQSVERVRVQRALVLDGTVLRMQNSHATT